MGDGVRGRLQTPRVPHMRCRLKVEATTPPLEAEHRYLCSGASRDLCGLAAV